jgi:hypothetical protein
MKFIVKRVQEAIPTVERCVIAVMIICSLVSCALFASTYAFLEHTSSGSGAIISPDGYILTNNHVIEGASSLSVELTSGDRYPARVIATDPDRDLALIKVDARDLKAIPISAGRAVQVGESVVSIGSPQGLVGTVSVGIITAVGRCVENLGLEDLYQTNAGIAQGSSGGPLIDQRGQLVGINVAVAISGGEHVPLTEFGFSIPIQYAQGLLSYVSTLPSPGVSNDGPLSVPEIATRYSAATVYIVSVAESPLSSLLPSEIAGYLIWERYTWQKPLPAKPEPLSPEQREWVLPPSLLQQPFLMKDSFSLPGGLSSNDSRLGSEPEEWASVSGNKSLSSSGAQLSVQILLAVYETASQARTAAKHVLQQDMQGLKEISQGTYTAGDLSFDARTGLATAKGTFWTYCLSGVDHSKEEANKLFAYAVQERPKCPNTRVGARIRQTITTAIENLFVAISISWKHIDTLPVFTYYPTDTTGEGEYTYTDSCVVYWKKITEVRKYLLTGEEKEKVLQDSTRTLICIDDLEKETKEILSVLVNTLAKNL